MSSLSPKYAEFLHPGEILPGGWLKRQLEIQAEGLSGHLEDFWVELKDSAWIGGKGEGWERGPYWLDGVVPLAYLLNNSHLIGRVKLWVNYIIDHQHEDGWLGPIVDDQIGKAYDPWPVFVVLKALTQYRDITGDTRVEAAMSRFFTKLQHVLNETPLEDWGRFRWGELLVSIYWLYEKTGEESLLDLARTAHAQKFNWQGHFGEFPFRDKLYRGKRNDSDDRTSMSSHVVNNAMAVKYPALWARMSGDGMDTECSRRIVEILDRFHGQATGMFSGDEHLAGRSPSQGTELCAVVEYMYSMEWLMSLTGRMEYADRLESVAFNALPATFKPDMWAHQYDQQCNQAVCRYSEENIYTTNDADSNLYGLDPNCGCCTANMHQAWPKFASSLWMMHGDGLQAFSYAPCTVNTSYRGVKVNVAVETEYPFSNIVRIKVNAARETSMKLRLRQPGWARHLEIRCADSSFQREREGHCYAISADWSKGINFDIEFPMEARWESRYNEAITLKRGPLIYALAIEEQWTESKTGKPQAEPPHGEWEVYPRSPWNVALKQQEARKLMFEHHEISETPYSRENPPVTTIAPARLVPGWTLEKNAAAPPPPSPLCADDLSKEETTATLIPYGCTNLRITEFPWYNDTMTKHI